jgi:hypothetical protein
VTTTADTPPTSAANAASSRSGRESGGGQFDGAGLSPMSLRWLVAVTGVGPLVGGTTSRAMGGRQRRRIDAVTFVPGADGLVQGKRNSRNEEARREAKRAADKGTRAAERSSGRGGDTSTCRK